MAISVYKETVNFNVPSGSDGGFSALPAIPAGKVVRVRYVSADFLVSGSGSPVSLQLTSNAGNYHFIPEHTGGDGTTEVFVVSQLTYIYLSSGVSYGVGFKRWPASGGGVICNVILSGELIDA